MSPLVSVIIPTRDRPTLLREAIASVQAQTFRDYEIVVVVNGQDNPSTPATLAAAQAAGCRTMRLERSGIAAALNAGSKAAQGKWLAFLDDDDLWEPNKLEVEVAAAQTEAADVVFCNIHLFDETGSVAAPPSRPPSSLSAAEAMTLRNHARGCSSTMARREAVLALGGFDEALDSPDWDMWMRLAWHYRLAWIDAYLARVRQHRQNTSKGISWAYWTLVVQRKSLRTLPRELRHLRPRILGEMARVAMKGAESYVRRNYLDGIRKAGRSGPGDGARRRA